MHEQPQPLRASHRGRRSALASVLLGLLAVVLAIYPSPLLALLQRWLDILPLFLPFLVGALASGLAVRSLVRAKRAYWLAITGLAFGLVGMALGAVLALIMTYVLLHQRYWSGPTGAGS
jgi:hypothetical protein